jgi:MoaA/NifB/PqqE/SkfB family radical SAM enzyme
MCNPATSTRWYEDAYKLEEPEVDYNEYTKTFEIIRNSFGKHNTEFWSTLKDWITELRVIYIYGGEPMLNPETWDWLEHGVRVGASKNIIIDITTNLMIWNQKYLDILKQYKNVKLNVSLDSSDAKEIEYIRHLSNAETLFKNARRMNEYFKDHDNVEVSFTYTVTSLNIYRIDYHLDKIIEMTGINDYSLNFVYTPGIYDVRHLPNPIKKEIRDDVVKLKSEQHPGIDTWFDALVPGCDQLWPEFCAHTDKLDQIRGQSFKDSFPEWWEKLSPYWYR